MNLIDIFLIALGLSADAFAVAVSLGLGMVRGEKSSNLTKAIIVGLYFGAFQAGMPIIGYIMARLFSDQFGAYGHFVAFVLLCFIGGKMIWGGIKDNNSLPDERQKANIPDKQRVVNMPDKQREANVPDVRQEANVPDVRQEVSIGVIYMITLALATSIDALAVGVSFALLDVNALTAAPVIGFTTFLLSVAGVRIGKAFGAGFQNKANLIGGIILVLIGVRMLVF